MTAKQQDPAFILTYGQSGTGKTLDQMRAFPNGLFIADQGATRGAINLLGFAPRTGKAASIAVAAEMMKKHATPGSAVILDDFSLLAERTVFQLSESKKGHDLWGEVRNQTLRLRIAARELNCHVIINAHEAAPVTDRVRGWMPGGPYFQGSARHDLPKACDIVWRAVRCDARLSWPYGYQSHNSDASYITKDRLGVTSDLSPMNMGELLRAGGFDIQRRAAWAWHEEYVEKIAVKLLPLTEVDERRKFLVAVKEQIQKKKTVTDAELRWVFADALDRADIRRTLINPLASML